MMRWKHLAGRAAAIGAIVAASLPLVTPPGGSAHATAAALASVSEAVQPVTTAQPATAQLTTAQQAATHDTVLTLPTGDQVRLIATPGGGQDVNPVLGGQARDTGSSGFVRFGVGGDAYAVPYAAVPYLGSLLDPRLFDVSYLARIGAQRAASLPVTVTYRDGHSTPLTTAQAPALGAELAADWRAVRAGRPLAAADPLNGIARISLTPAASDAAAPPLPGAGMMQTRSRPHGAPPHYRTLTINVIGQDGQPGEAVGWVQNLDDPFYGAWVQAGVKGARLYGQPSPIKISVPDGAYSVQLAILTPHDGASQGVDAALVAQPQFTVGADTTVTLDARTAKPYSAAISPAVDNRYRVDELVYTRTTAKAGGYTSVPFYLGLATNTTEGSGTASTLLAAPTAPVTDGTVGFAAITAIYPTDLSAPTAGSRYFLVFPSDTGIPSSLTYHISQRDLTTVDEHIYDDPVAYARLDGERLRLIAPTVYTSWGDTRSVQFEGAAGGLPAGSHTDYWYSANPALTRWQGQATVSYGWTLDANTYLEIKPGQRLSETWGEAPLLPAAAAVPELDGDGGESPPTGPFQIELPPAPAARQGDFALLNMQQADATAASHSVTPMSMASSMAFWRNGVQVLNSPPASTATGNDGFTFPIGALLPLLDGPATYRLDWQLAPWTVDQTGDPTAQTDTSWTFRSGPADQAVVPASEECGPVPAKPCTFLPLLFLRYDLPLDPDSQVPAGSPITFTFTAEHQQGEAPPAGVTATVAASFDDGKTWTTAAKATPLGGGRFTITISQPALSATSGFASLRVTAGDNAGNSVTQTIIRAYGLTG